MGDFYQPGNTGCQYSDATGNVQHLLYVQTSLADTELNVYTHNGIIGNIKSHVLNYLDSPLQQNYYYLYFKPYSLWTAQCQSQYTTEYVA